MPSSAVRTFTDPDEYAAAIRGGEVELTVAARGDFHAKLIRIDLHCLWMQRFADNLPRVIHSAHVPGRASVKFRTAPGPSFFAASLEIHSTNLVRHSPADNYHQRSSGSAHFGTMSLPVEDMAALGETMAGADLTPPRYTMLITPHLLRWRSSSGCTRPLGISQKTPRKFSPIQMPLMVSSRPWSKPWSAASPSATAAARTVWRKGSTRS
jgi:hypothetical protein